MPRAERRAEVVWEGSLILDQTAFENVARQAEENCPVSNALRNNVQISVKAHLEG